MERIKVYYIQRKPRLGFNFSIEQIFDRIRDELKEYIRANVVYAKYYNTGYWSKLTNIWNAWRFQQNGIQHITGEVHFMNLLLSKKNVVLTIHDCGMVNRKSGVQLKLIKWLYLTAPISRSAIVTTVSQKTKEEVIAYTNCKPEKIQVIPNPIGKQYQSYSKVFNTNRPNILQIGTAHNKNLERLIPALSGLSCTLTVVGKLKASQVTLLDTHKISYHNVYNISDDELLECYKNCDILAFVSTFEGFGMPIVEANAVERIVITSNLSSMPEVALDAACIVDPYDIEAIRKGLTKIIKDNTYREELISNGRKNALRFNAKTIALQYLDVYRSIMKRRHD